MTTKNVLGWKKRRVQLISYLAQRGGTLSIERDGNPPSVTLAKAFGVSEFGTTSGWITRLEKDGDITTQRVGKRLINTVTLKDHLMPPENLPAAPPPEPVQPQIVAAAPVPAETSHDVSQPHTGPHPADVAMALLDLVVKRINADAALGAQLAEMRRIAQAENEARIAAENQAGVLQGNLDAALARVRELESVADTLVVGDRTYELRELSPDSFAALDRFMRELPVAS